MPFARPFDSNAAMTMQRAFFLFTVLFALPVAARGGWLADAWHQYAGAGGIAAAGRYAVVFPIAAALPSPRLTPGATNPAVTQADIHETICVPGYTRTIRPAERYTERLKRAGIRRYGYGDRRLRDYEEDHLISLDLGGSPDSPRNLWPEPHHVVGAWGSYTKDRLENRLHSLVCQGRISLVRAQRQIARNWIAAYREYVGPRPDQHRRHRHGD